MRSKGAETDISQALGGKMFVWSLENSNEPVQTLMQHEGSILGLAVDDDIPYGCEDGFYLPAATDASSASACPALQGPLLGHQDPPEPNEAGVGNGGKGF